MNREQRTYLKKRIEEIKSSKLCELGNLKEKVENTDFAVNRVALDYVRWLQKPSGARELKELSKLLLANLESQLQKLVGRGSWYKLDVNVRFQDSGKLRVTGASDNVIDVPRFARDIKVFKEANASKQARYDQAKARLEARFTAALDQLICGSESDTLEKLHELESLDVSTLFKEDAR